MRGSAATRRAARAAARQHGNVSYTQMREFGFSPGEIERRIRAGWLVARHTRVFGVGHVPRTRESRWHAAVLALECDARVALSHRAAGALWEFVRGGVPTEVTVATTAGRSRRDGIIVHRAPLPAAHVTHRDGIPVTTPLRTLLDLAAVLEMRPLARAFEEAQVLQLLKPLELAVEVMLRPRHRGSGRLRKILDGAVDPTAVRSVLELRFLRLCAAHGIPRPLVNASVGPWTPDFLWPENGVVVETDGAAFHRTAAARRRDARKEDFLHAAGLEVIRLTWADVTQAPGATAHSILSALGGATSGAYTSL